MENLFDEFSKSLAESMPRRESLRRLGAVFAGAVLSPLGVGTAWAGRTDPCKAFCKCGTKKQQSQCLAACRACNGNTGRIGGSCGKYVCCPTAACGGVCSDLLHDPNCGPAEITAALGMTSCLIAPISPPTSSTAEVAEGCAPHLLPTRPSRASPARASTTASPAPSAATGPAPPWVSIPTTVAPAATSVADQHRIAAAGNAAHALRGARFAVVFAPTWTLTTPTAERAASFALTDIAARVCAHPSILRIPMRFRRDLRAASGSGTPYRFAAASVCVVSLLASV